MGLRLQPLVSLRVVQLLLSVLLPLFPPLPRWVVALRPLQWLDLVVLLRRGRWT